MSLKRGYDDRGSSRTLGHRLGRGVVVVGFGMGSKGILPITPAAAHSIVPCGSQSPVVDAPAVPGERGQAFKVSPYLDGDAPQNAVDAANAWAYFSDVDYFQTTANFPGWDLYLTEDDDPADPGLAGRADFRWRSNCVLEGSYVWYNQTHMA